MTSVGPLEEMAPNMLRFWRRYYSGSTANGPPPVRMVEGGRSRSARDRGGQQVSREFVSNEEIIQEARRRVDQGAWDYLVGGSESETTLRRNRLAFDRIAFRPRILVDVSHVDPSTTFMGQTLRIPAILAPIGSLQVFHPEAAVAATKAATDFGIRHAVSSVTEPAAAIS